MGLSADCQLGYCGTCNHCDHTCHDPYRAKSAKGGSVIDEQETAWLALRSRKMFPAGAPTEEWLRIAFNAGWNAALRQNKEKPITDEGIAEFDRIWGGEA